MPNLLGINLLGILVGPISPIALAFGRNGYPATTSPWEGEICQMMIKPYKGIYPKIHPTVFIVESAIIIGDVEIGEYSSVWFNAVIRGDVHYIRIGNRTNIQDLCMLHVTKDTYPLILGNDITVGHSVTLHGCTIKDRCLIGMGVTILDKAVVSEDCIIGAGALVTEGAVIPPGTLAFGAPAKPKRDLTEEEKARIKQSARNYIEYARTYGL